MLRRPHNLHLPKEADMKSTTVTLPSPAPRISIADLGREPFRVFFPAGVLAGLTGVALWPLHFMGWFEMYPGQNHARIMACGLFGAFIFGFLGTALPRLLSVPALHWAQTLTLLVLHLSMVAAFSIGKMFVGDVLFLVLLLAFVTLLAIRFPKRQDSPPPGFILVVLAFGCVTAGTLLAVAQHLREMETQWVTLQRLLSYQGFVLLPILGIGPFLLPRFFGLESAHALPESRALSALWKRKAVLALAAGVFIIASFFLEARGFHRLAHTVRFISAVGYLLLEMPFRRVARSNAAGLCLLTALFVLCAGFLAVAILPEFRVGLLHLTLVGGFAVLTFVVATRVVFGHSGNIARMQQRNAWLYVSVGLMLLGMATRISGDFLPKILATHYSYGAASWIIGVLIWSAVVLPKALRLDPEP